MAFVPYEHLIMRVSLAPEEVRLRLAERVGRGEWGDYGRKQKPYEGWIEGDHFKISKNIRYRDSLLPVIVGDIRGEPPGSVVELRMRPAIATLVVIACGLMVPVFMSGLLIVSSLFDPNFHGAWWMPLVLALLWYTICTGWFRLELMNARTVFEELLAEPAPVTLAQAAPMIQSARSWVGGTSESSRYGRSDRKEIR